LIVDGIDLLKRHDGSLMPMVLPCVEFGYASDDEADAAREKFLEAMEGVATVKGLG
jgi:hypothetical protein